MRADGGVTLIELLLVIVLIGLVGAISVPAFTGYIDRARITRAVGEISTLSLRLQRWESNRGRFPDTLAEAGLDGSLDPWGRPYRYLNIALATPGAVRKDKNLVPINTDFDLYSMGRDGRTVPALTARDARDDIVRANDGNFVGLAADY